MKWTKKIHFQKWRFLVWVFFCFLYAALLQLVHAVHFVHMFAQDGRGILGEPWDTLYALFLWLPALIMIYILLRQYGGKQVLAFTWYTIKNHWLKIEKKTSS